MMTKNNLRKFILFVIVGIVLILSWLFPFTRILWDSIDASAFRFFNETLNYGISVQKFWAITNMRAFDIIGGIVVLVFCGHFIASENSFDRKKMILSFLLFLSFMLFSKFLWDQFYTSIKFSRLSPSLFFDDALKISDTVKGIKFKEASTCSFPSDHGIVLMGLVFFFAIKRNVKYGFISLLIFIPLLIPRLVSGAHWLTDTLVGSLYIAILSTALLLFTPLEEKLISIAEKIVDFILGKYAELMK